MQPELIVIDNYEDIQKLRSYLEDKEYVAYDCETTGLSKSDTIVGISICAEESKAYYVIFHQDRPRDILYVQQIHELIQLLTTKQLIMHNGVFDCMMAESNFKVNLIDSLHTDTMVLAHLLDENRPVALKSLAYDMYGESSTQEQKEMQASVVANGGIWTSSNKEMYKADPYLLGKYGAKDAWLTYKLFTDLVPELYEQGLEKFFYEEESMPLLKGPTYELNTTGLQVDTNKLIQLKKTLEAECLAAKDFVLTEIHEHVKDKYPKGFNIGSSQQLSWLLFGKLGLEFNTLTKAGKTVCKSMGLYLPYTRTAKRDFIAHCEMRQGEAWQQEAIVNGKIKKAKKVEAPWKYIACDKETLKKLAPKLKWVDRLLEYQRKKKLLNTYVEGIEERIQYGVIRPGFLQHGTTSGRYASRNPNFQNLPRDDKRIKECIIPRPDRAFVGADYSQLEPRVFSYTSGDERLCKAFDGTTDFYSTIGIEVFDKLECLPLKDGHPKAFGVLYPKLRQDSKVFTLASTYGATGAKLAPMMGKSTDDAQEDINNYFEKFPKVRQMMLDSHEMAKKQGFVTNLFGRKRRMPDAMKITKLYGNGDLPYEARNLLNLAVNHRIQSTAASIVNRAAIRFHQNAKQSGIECKLVLQVHDSLIIECNQEDAEDVAALLQDAMENTVMLSGVKLEAIPKIGKNLGQV